MNTETVWTTYRSALEAFLRARVANPQDAEDLLQEVLLKVHGGLADLPPETPLKPWLYRVARNTVIDFYRRSARGRKEAALHTEDLWYGAAEEAPHDLDLCIEPMLKGLPPEQAALLHAVDLEGEPQKDYAARNGLAYSTLKSQVQTARKALRHQFDSCCSFGRDHRGTVTEYAPKPDRCGNC